LKELNTIRQHIERYKGKIKDLIHYFKLINDKPSPENKYLKEIEQKFEEGFKIWNYLDLYHKQRND